jgi:hypothetical protein
MSFTEKKILPGLKKNSGFVTTPQRKYFTQITLASRHKLLLNIEKKRE